MRGRRDRVAILAVFVLVFVCGSASLGLRSEDWYLLPPCGEAWARGYRGFGSLLDGPRIQLTTFAVQGLLIRAFGFAAAPLLALSLLSHLASCLLLYRILLSCEADRDFALAGSLSCLLMPTLTSEVFYATHAFFVLPVSFLLALILLYLRPLRGERVDLAALTIVALAGEFAGEQAVPLFYAVFAVAGFRALRAPDRRASRFLRAAVPAAVCAASLGFVFWRNTYRFLRESAHDAALTRAPVAKVLFDYAKLHAYALYPWNWLYGGFTQRVSAATWASAAAAAAAVGIAFARREEEEPLGRAPRLRLAAACVLAAALYLAPILLSTVSGYRPGAAPKYLYASGFCFALLLTLGLDSVCRRAARPAAARRRAFAAALAYLAFLTSYSLHDLWGTQKRVDERVWSEIERHDLSRVRYILIDGSAPKGLAPDWLSSAYSDFVDGGAAVPSRLRLLRGLSTTVVTKEFEPAAGGLVALGDLQGRRHDARPEEILAVVFRSGARFGDLDGASVRSFASFDEYRKARRAGAF